MFTSYMSGILIVILCILGFFTFSGFGKIEFTKVINFQNEVQKSVLTSKKSYLILLTLN